MNKFILPIKNKLSDTQFKTSLILFFSLFIIIFFKCYFFSYEVESWRNAKIINEIIQTGNSIDSTTMTKTFEGYKKFLLRTFIKISTAIFISSLIFFIKQKYIIIPILLLIDIWSFANIMYYRTNDLLIDNYALSMVGNLDGFTDSILFYIEPQDTLFILSTIIFCIILQLINNKNQYLKLGISFIILAFIINIFTNTQLCKSLTINPFSNNARTTLSKNFLASPIYTYTNNLSICHNLIINIKDLLNKKDSSIPISNTDKKIINNILNVNYKLSEEKLLIIIIESFESWLICDNIMPNLTHFINNNQNHILFANNIKSQIKAARSSDGQMIINTGILPISEGATCYLYAKNEFPSLTKALKGNSATILPHETKVWNQKEMSVAYGYDTTIVKYGNDIYLLNKTVDCINKYDMLQAITLYSHSPFDKGAKESPLIIEDKNLSKKLTTLIKCFNHTDDALKMIFDKFETDSSFRNYTIAITGDHNFNSNNLIKEYNKDSKYLCNPIKSVCPLIIYSPNIKEKTIITDECYQMDIYPTILHCIKADNYYWKGLGVNLLDSVARNNRTISEKEAFDLSNKLIRNNYFSSIVK